ncbi:MAG: 16S rRNA (uracil(1498)-N(3))-methyltransferase [Candidatus Cloacimonadota bacterium]|nr:16S rRNA (uracil(1498)-N(3))-methyltransferase [Candidatus Cloacimonadota bacterium]
MPCFYTANLKEEDKAISISGDEFHHIKNVFRKQINDTISLSNGNGVYASGTIKYISKKNIDVDIISIQKFKKSKPYIHFAFTLLRNKNDQFTVEKLTELGVKSFYPILSERSVRKPNKNTVSKFQKNAISAMKQCDNAFLPNINEVQNLKTLLDYLKKKNIIPLVASEFEKNNFLQNVFEYSQDEYCVIIGPEGGFSENEIKYFKDKNIQTFSLGNHILRGETAAITTASQIFGKILEYDKKYY